MGLGVAGFRPRVHRGPPRRGEGKTVNTQRCTHPEADLQILRMTPFPVTQTGRVVAAS